jgi:Tol biopolymer transport system component
MRRIVVVGIFVCTCLAVAMAFAGSSRASFAGQNGPVFFDSLRNDDWDVYSMNPDGSDRVDLTNNAAFDGNPSASPDGSQVAFLSERARPGHPSIYIMNRDGSNVRLVDTGAPSIIGNVSWAPDGKHLVFGRATNLANPSVNIWTSAIDGSGLKQLTTGQDIDPKWSPYGTKILFSGWSPATGWGLKTIKPDGSNRQNVIDHAIYGDWSPDSRKIAFVRTLPFFDYRIFTANADGTGATQLTFAPGAADSNPVWSPDGKQIMFQRDPQFALNLKLFRMNADGSNLVQVTSPGRDQDPSWGVAVKLQPTSIGDCKDSGWKRFSSFKNQGDCVSFVVSPKKNGSK